MRLPLLALSLSCLSCAAARPQAPASAAPRWPDAWEVRTGQIVELAAVVGAVSQADFLLLGEVHDNPQHHVIQAELIRGVIASGRRPALAFEMLDVPQQPVIDASLASSPRDPQALAAAVSWERSGWPAFELYRPVFAAGLEGGARIVAAGLPREQARRIAREGASALDPDLAARLERVGPLPPEQLERLREEMRQAHCGAFPESRVAPFVVAQRAKDARMAERMASAGSEGAVLIAGAGHVRTDVGVPSFLRLEAPARRIVSVGLLESAPGDLAEEAQRRQVRSGALAYDFVVFTPAAPREDPCRSLRVR